MSLPRMLWHLACEHFVSAAVARVPEPELVMEDPAQVDAFLEAGEGSGIMAAVYLFHAVQTLPLFRAGDTVLDLACGPGTQLLQIARLHPEVRFIGVDASETMLERAARTLHGAANIELHHGDITRLDAIPAASVDGITCNLALHHLPDQAALHTTFTGMARVLKADGSFYISDFCRFRRAATQLYFATDRVEEQSPLFTADYLHSLRAAFSEAELRAAARPLARRLQVRRNLLTPLMLVLHGPQRNHPLDAARRARVSSLYESLPAMRREDFRDLARFFHFGGYPLAAKPW